jgi:hypothetical protein
MQYTSNNGSTSRLLSKRPDHRLQTEPTHVLSAWFYKPPSKSFSLSWPTPVVIFPIVTLFFALNMSFLFVRFEFLAFFLSFLLPTFSLPLANPPVLDTYFRAFIDGISSAETELRTVVELLPTAVPVKETLLADAAPTTAPSPDSPILFLPQNPSPEGFVISEPGTAVNNTLGSEPVPANSTSNQPPATGVLTPLVMAYYPGWVADVFPPERIDFSRFDWIDFAFAEPDGNFTLSRDGSNILSRLVSVAHQKGKKVKLSVGGWDGSKKGGLTAELTSSDLLTSGISRGPSKTKAAATLLSATS